MVLIFLAALVELADFGHAQKDSVLQFPAEMTIQVGHNATLHCNFSTSYSNPYMFWYQQCQTQSPQMLLRVDKWKPQVDSGRFSSTLSVETSQVFLHVRDAELQDGTAYFCALSPQQCPQGITSAGGSPYVPESMTVSLSNSWTIQAGHNTTLHCDFSTTDPNPYIYWYQQLPNQSPQVLLWSTTTLSLPADSLRMKQRPQEKKKDLGSSYCHLDLHKFTG
ncbi:uncharacterized protein LOC129195235 [Grus americana]|uniref:uncharacterized protein LOC129195235 n=1 Tax=Grus americana TaxID=9117 RepID=UPI00240890E5|nr:uncharacterized protein LOC129195235 [Grus americana]